VCAGKALHVGISSYDTAQTRAAARTLRELGAPLLVHQPRYSLLDRWIEHTLLDALEADGVGCVVYSPLAQGVLAGRFLDGVPGDSRAVRGIALPREEVASERLGAVRALADIARSRGQTLAQLALAWVLRDPRVTTALVGASSVTQLDENLDALARLDFTATELDEIDRLAPRAALDAPT
jgi:L-glyceraldehyde 3-phosphate reductase